MASAGIGVYMLEIARMERTMGRTPAFVPRVFTERERAYCDGTARPASRYAALIAARGAVLKALGAEGSAGVGLHDVTVSYDETGRPHAELAGAAARMAEEQGVHEIALSLAPTHDVAVANAVAVTDEVRPKVEEKKDPEAELRDTFRAARTVIDELEQRQQSPMN